MSKSSDLETKVRELIHKELGDDKSLTELEYCEVVSDALNTIVEGVEMRLQELEDEQDEIDEADNEEHWEDDDVGTDPDP